MTDKAPTLIADIGGTHARFALARDGQVLGKASVFSCRDYPDLATAANAFIAELTANHPRRGIIAVAAPITGDQVQVTNLDWSFSTDQLRQDLGLDALDIVNDFTAIAWAVPRLKDNERQHVGGGVAHADAPIVIIGPGSGLGVAALIPVRGGWTVLPTEGGHVTMAATTAEEDRVLDTLRHRFGHVSAERVLSGQGLANIYNALADLDGHAPQALRPEAITAQALVDPASRAGTVLDMFCAFLGTAASNAALSFDARGGVYLAGGIIGKLEGAFAASDFRQRFEAKGRYTTYLSHIPTFILNHPFPALAGLAKGPLPPTNGR